MVVYIQLNLVAKISSSVDVVETAIFDNEPSLIVTLKIANQSSGMKLAQDDASPYQVWLQKVRQLRGYPPDEHSLEF